MNASDLNSFRISAVLDRLSLHIRGQRKNDTVEFINLCLSLARGIDFAIANHEVPRRSEDFPSLIKQVCESRNDQLELAAIMVLMISVKNACQSGWFSDRDSEDLTNLAKEIADSFGSVSNFNTQPSSSHSVVSTIISRYYPRIKMGHIFAFLEVEPGFEAYVSDFQISKNLKSSPGDKIRLFVVQTDSVETSSCLITPPKVNFLLNGKGVDRRTNLFTDPGPQMPTVVTHLLKYGTNLLQAVGEFNGHYIIAVAFMSEMPIPDIDALQDYEQHAPTTVDPDSEVIEGPSRISLNCPISFKRIRTPVKGRSCKHIQCFDFGNYVDINSKNPSWRCPHCNQHVCFTEIRVDQQMVKVLKEVGPDASNIIFSSDGSWKAVTESSDAVQKSEDKTQETSQDKSPQPEEVLDLTQIDDAMDAVATHETVDRKLFTSHQQSQFTTQAMSTNPPIANRNDINQSNHLEDDFWSGIYMSTFGASNDGPNTQIMPPPVLTDSFTSTSREVEAFHGNALTTTSVPQAENILPNALQLQQYQSGNPSVTNEYGRFPSFPRNVTRTPTAVQALPAQTPPSVPQQSSRNNAYTVIQNGLSAASQALPAAPNIGNSSPRVNPHQILQTTPSSLYQHPGLQQNRQLPIVRPPQQNVRLQAQNQVQNAYNVPNERHNSSQQRPLLRLTRVDDLIQQTMQSPRNFSWPQGVSQERSIHTTGTATSNQQAHLVAAANRTVHMAIDPTRAPPSYSMSPGNQRSNLGITSPPVVRTDAYDPTADQSWRPAGRMRGALSGQAYADALNQYIIRPNQQAQAAARPVSNVASLPTNVTPPQVQAFTGNRVGPGISALNHTPAGPGSRPGSAERLPEGSSGLK